MKNTIEVIKPAPVINIPEFHKAFGGRDGAQIPKNSQGHPLHYEFVALPGMHFQVEEILPRHHHRIYRISTTSYPSPKLYIDSRFVKPGKGVKRKMPALEEIQRRMEELVGTAYVQGGNWSRGIPELLHLYPPRGSIDEKMKILWMMKGVDAAGLLYEATDGLSPRRMDQLIHFGTGLAIEGKRADEILSLLKPMDMVVWPGHVWFVLDESQSIESKPGVGVIKENLSKCLEKTCKMRKGVNAWEHSLDPDKYFVIRRLEVKTKLGS